MRKEMTIKEAPTREQLKRKSITIYYIECCLEYMITILVSGTFLARLTAAIGVSDSVTGIITSVISLACVMQLVNLFIPHRNIKRRSIIIYTLHELLMLTLYIIPLLNINSTVRIVIFVISVVLSQFILNIGAPGKYTWFVSFVPDRERGKVTAMNEFISLGGAIIFSYGMGKVTDHFVAVGNLKLAFICGAAVIAVLLIAHTVSLLTAAVPDEDLAPKSVEKKKLGDILSIFKNKTLLKITLLFVFWYAANYSTTSFYGSYQLNELGFSQSFAVILSSVGSISRMIVEPLFGRYADRHSFSKMVVFGFIAAMLAFCVASFATERTGRICFAVYYVFNGIACGAIGCGLANIVFDYTPNEQRSNAYSITMSIAGLVGFLTTLAVSPLVAQIQAAGNTFLGMHIYAQQVTSVIGIILTALTVVYTITVIMRLGPKVGEEN